MSLLTQMSTDELEKHVGMALHSLNSAASEVEEAVHELMNRAFNPPVPYGMVECASCHRLVELSTTTAAKTGEVWGNICPLCVDARETIEGIINGG